QMCRQRGPIRRKRRRPEPQRGSLAGPVLGEGIACDRVTAAGDAALCIPQREASHIELNALTSRRAAVLGQPTAGALVANQVTKRFLFHGVPPRRGVSEEPDSPGSRREAAPT